MKKPGPETEQRVVRREGERRAGAHVTRSHDVELDRLFAAHRDRVYRLCLSLVGDPQLAEELVQDTLTTAFEKLPEFRGNFAPWIFGIARMRARNLRRKKAELLSEDGLVDPSSAAAGALRLLERHEREALLAAAAATLSPEEQEVVHLRYVEEVPLKQVDELLGLTGSGARGVLQRCKRKLRGELERRLEALGRGRSFLHSEAT